MRALFVHFAEMSSRPDDGSEMRGLSLTYDILSVVEQVCLKPREAKTENISLFLFHSVRCVTFSLSQN